MRMVLLVMALAIFSSSLLACDSEYDNKNYGIWTYGERLFVGRVSSINVANSEFGIYDVVFILKDGSSKIYSIFDADLLKSSTTYRIRLSLQDDWWHKPSKVWNIQSAEEIR